LHGHETRVFLVTETMLTAYVRSIKTTTNVKLIMIVFIFMEHFISKIIVPLKI
jgi:hypothetical protein